MSLRLAVNASGEAVIADEKWQSLLAYRRARELCIRCADKWSRNHKCADSVELHAVQEPLDIFSLEVTDQSTEDPSDQPEAYLFVTLSIAAMTRHLSSRTMCLNGSTQGPSINILVDSGS